MNFRRYRMLNERRGIFGLYFSDLIAGCCIFVFSNMSLEGTKIQIIAFIAPLVTLGILVPIRKKFRKGVIRSAITYFVRGRVVYDPRNI